MSDQPVAVVTGAGGGIGSAVLERLAEDAFKAVALDLDEPAMNSVAERLRRRGREAIALALDVGDSVAVAARFAEIEATCGPIQCVVNCAGIHGKGHAYLQDMTIETWTEIIQVNLTGTFNCISAVASHMTDRRSGAIVNVSSVTAARGAPGRGAYNATKGAIEALTRTAAAELAGLGIRVNAVAPGYVETALLRDAFVDGRIEEAKVIAAIPSGRLADPQEIAEVIGFLCDTKSSYITGQVIVVDGGFLLNYPIPLASKEQRAVTIWIERATLDG